MSLRKVYLLKFACKLFQASTHDLTFISKYTLQFITFLLLITHRKLNIMKKWGSDFIDNNNIKNIKLARMLSWELV